MSDIYFFWTGLTVRFICIWSKIHNKVLWRLLLVRWKGSNIILILILFSLLPLVIFTQWNSQCDSERYRDDCHFSSIGCRDFDHFSLKGFCNYIHFSSQGHRNDDQFSSLGCRNYDHFSLQGFRNDGNFGSIRCRVDDHISSLGCCSYLSLLYPVLTVSVFLNY
jgi:hypothetical protein